MRIIKFLLWTGLAMGAGVFIATFNISGHTPLQHIERTIKKAGPSVDKVKDGAEGIVSDVKKKVAADTVAPTEQHSPDDRNAISHLIASHQK